MRVSNTVGMFRRQEAAERSMMAAVMPNALPEFETFSLPRLSLTGKVWRSGNMVMLPAAHRAESARVRFAS